MIKEGNGNDRMLEGTGASPGINHRAAVGTIPPDICNHLKEHMARYKPLLYVTGLVSIGKGFLGLLSNVPTSGVDLTRHQTLNGSSLSSDGGPVADSKNIVLVAGNKQQKIWEKTLHAIMEPGPHVF